jgi:dipeptidyl-peptidase-4
LSTGKLKRAITEGDWLVRNILHLDSERRELWIQTAGRKAGRNPYYCDIVRINMDSSELFTIVATDHDYVVCDQRSRISASDMSAIGVSPCGNYVATTRSRVDQVPVSLLYDRDGQEIVTVETASVDGLPANWQWPEPIMLKAADNKTDIMAVVFRPSDFDPSQSYPILDHSYGYVSPVGSFSNSHMGSQQYLSPAACAELGFIVVVIHNRGKDGLRDVAFNNFEDPDFPEQPRFSSSAPQVDCVAGIKQLARLYPYMDINRVGVMETGSMPTALIGLLVHGDLYKVGVSNVACANSHMLAAQGRLPIGEEYPKLEDQVAKLRGKLLVISGMLEWAMPVAMTFRLIQALQQANKRFDMVLVPNLAHGRSSYTIQRSWDYLVEHLLGLTPPEDYQLDVSRGRMMDEEIKRLEEDYEG